MLQVDILLQYLAVNISKCRFLFVKVRKNMSVSSSKPREIWRLLNPSLSRTDTNPNIPVKDVTTADSGKAEKDADKSD